MLTIGRVCVKLAGRDAGKICAIVDTYDNGLVLIDGETRRRKCNMRHLLPKEDNLSLKKDASHEDVIFAFKKINVTITPRTPKKAEHTKEEKTPTQTPKEDEKEPVKKEKIPQTKPAKKTTKKKTTKATSKA